MPRCKATMHSADGLEHRCNHEAVSNGDSGFDLCYLHDKYATGKTQPVPTNWKPEKYTHMTIAGIPNLEFVFPEDIYTDTPYEMEVAELPAAEVA